jgi:hypothetical protein
MLERFRAAQYGAGAGPRGRRAGAPATSAVTDKRVIYFDGSHRFSTVNNPSMLKGLLR